MYLHRFFSIRKKTLILILLLLISFFTFIKAYANHTLNKVDLSISEIELPAETHAPLSTPTPVPTLPPKILQPLIKAEREKYNNPDIFAVLKIPNTVIDYPVVQSSDNEYYLLKDPSKNYSISGSLFFDYENSFEQRNKHYIIYGHNMNADIMFHSLRYYREKSYYDDHKYITLETPYETQTYEVFAFYKTSVDFYYLHVFFNNDFEFLDLASQMKEKSIYDTGLEIDKDDTILTLSTCSNQETTTRYVLNAKLISAVPYTESLYTK